MKAAVCSAYGPPDVVQVTDVARPVPNEGEVLIKVRAAALNPLDWHLKRGQPRVSRLLTGLRRPRDARLGVDVAGQVEAVGANVRQFRPGDAVFGSCRGAFAEYACASELALVPKPPNVTFEQAACAPVAAYTSLQGLRDVGRIRPGQDVLINGAAGGVGTLAVQIARWLGAHVTGVCSTPNVEMVRSLGTDAAIDYTKEDFTQGARRYDLVFDLVANHPLLACRRVLTPQGVYIGAGVLAIEPGAGLMGRLILTPVLSGLGRRKMVPFMARRRQEDLTTIRDLMAVGKVTPVIGQRYPLSEVAEAIRRLEERHARGKIVLVVE